jgi:hypothetical protein
MQKKLPAYVLSKNYHCLFFLHSDFILSATPSALKSAFILFLEKTQNTQVKIGNSNCKEVISLDYKDYDALTMKYAEEGDPKLYCITETPDACIFDSNCNWEIYCDSRLNIAIGGCDRKFEPIIREVFFDSNVPSVYKDKYDYYEKNKFMYETDDNFKNTFFKNY